MPGSRNTQPRQIGNAQGTVHDSQSDPLASLSQNVTRKLVGKTSQSILTEIAPNLMP
jgi:hypothetical protein